MRQMMPEGDLMEYGTFASYCQQCRALHLKPWQDPPMYGDLGDDPQAARLLRRMLRAGISRYAPDPLAVLKSR